MFKNLLVDTITIETANVLPNGYGGFKEYWNEMEWAEADITWYDADINWNNSQIVYGLIDLQSGKENEISNKYVEQSTHILFLEIGIPINHTQRVIKDGEIYRVLYVDVPFQRHQEIYLEKVGVDNE